MAKTNSGLLEFKDDQKVLIALDDATSEVKKAVIIDADGTETDIAGGGGDVTVEALSVTENGIYSEAGKAYSPVTVNVAGGSSDFSTAQVTIVNNTTTDVDIYMPVQFDDEEEDYSFLTYEAHVVEGETLTVTTVLYKGITDAYLFNSQLFNVSVLGNVEYDSPNFEITGDCTITITAANTQS